MTTLSRQHIAVAVNPSAAQGAHRDYGHRLVEALRATGREVSELSTDSYEHLETLARAAVAGGVDALIVVVVVIVSVGAAPSPLRLGRRTGTLGFGLGSGWGGGGR
jgi:hypothetical protein